MELWVNEILDFSVLLHLPSFPPSFPSLHPFCSSPSSSFILLFLFLCFRFRFLLHSWGCPELTTSCLHLLSAGLIFSLWVRLDFLLICASLSFTPSDTLWWWPPLGLHWKSQAEYGRKLVNSKWPVNLVSKWDHGQTWAFTGKKSSFAFKPQCIVTVDSLLPKHN